jgi:endonuclease IV
LGAQPEKRQSFRHARQDLGLKLLTFHAGFIPHDPKDPGYAKILDRVRQIVDVFAAGNMDVAFETGQETADDLAGVLRQLNRPNLG